ncbi:histone deacetylase 6-like isoform X1 [Saccostrea echinata]|uniref:histone deacetylase 6-like isoform X1 n=1 Tax=Saccostrea echinata TaxID=191078 RepID=UPI002A7F8EAB|nr:histone deacetylase 6-like isoform X1 [Saccostrea echinata]
MHQNYSDEEQDPDKQQSGHDVGVKGQNQNIQQASQEIKDKKMTLEEIKQSGRAERQRRREERRRQQSDSDSESEYLVGKLAEIAISVKEPDLVEGTGLIYDKRMLKHENLWDKDYPEKPSRISGPFQRCCELGLTERCIWLEALHSTEDMVLLQHSQELIEKLKRTTEMSTEELKAEALKYDSVYFNQTTYECSLLSLGSTVELMEQILKKKVRNGMALIRPPGHHAMTEEFCGFCYFNNVAIAAKHALENFKLKKILIIDWDVHHGQGIQQMFYNDPRVLYFSIHRYEFGKFWPHLRESDYDFIGEEKGMGYNINVPLNQTGMTDHDYLAIFHQILMPIAFEFNPDFVVVSAGFDSAIGDPKGEMGVTPAAFAHLTHKVMSLAQGRVAVILEGGYCLKSLSESAALTLRALLDDPCPRIPPSQEPCDSVTESILNVIKVLRPYWKCLQYQGFTSDPCPFEEVNQSPPKPDIILITEENKPKEYPESLEPTKMEEYYKVEKRLSPVIDRIIASTNLSKAKDRTCIAYDEGMRAHCSTASYYHPESPDRITRIFDKHTEWGLTQRCTRVETRMATEAELTLIHSSAHVEEIKSLEEKNPFELKKLESNYQSIYLCKDSYFCARMAAGFVLDVVDNVLTGQSQNGVAIVRPPGHHAECSRAMGFCFFNNVGIAAKYAQNKYNVKKVLIVDWDVHHGNGTQHQFYEDSSVLFISLHRYDQGFFYPSTTEGCHTKVGTGEGRGFNVNIAWNKGPMGDSEYITAFQQVVMPIAYEFGPELVLVSAGFDAAMGDPLGCYSLTPAGYGHMTHMLSSLANGKVVLVLEGGYHLTAISNSMAMCTSILLGDGCPHLPYVQPKDSAVKCIQDVLDVQKQYWKSLKFRVNIKTDKKEDTEEAKQEEIERQKEDEDMKKIHELAEQLKDVTVFKDTENPREDVVVVENVTEDTEDVEQKKVHTEQPLKGEKSAVPEQSVLGGSDQTKGLSQETYCGGTEESGMGGGDSPGGNNVEKDPTTVCAGGGQSLGAEGGSDAPEASPVSANEVLRQLEAQGHTQMFAVTPLPWCPHLETVTPVPRGRIDTGSPCEDCGDLSENWTCLVCYKIYCSRFVNEHMLMHGVMETHLMCLSFSDLSVWCYGCDHYIDNPALFEAKNAAHLHKFGTSLPRPLCLS